jgi:PEP-CTERM motif
VRSRTLRSLFAALSCALVGAPALADPNLLANPGFEAGDFAGWTLRGSDTRPDHSFVSGPASYPGWNEWLPHAGSHFAALGAVEGKNLILSQSFATQPGESYLFGFQLGCDGETQNYFRALWNDTVLVTLQDAPETPGHDLIHGPPAAAYRTYYFPVVATSATTTITLVSVNDQGWWALDDVDVTPLPEPSSLALLAAGMLGVAASRRFRCPSLPASASACSSRRSTPTTRARPSRSTATSR